MKQGPKYISKTQYHNFIDHARLETGDLTLDFRPRKGQWVLDFFRVLMQLSIVKGISRLKNETKTTY